MQILLVPPKPPGLSGLLVHRMHLPVDMTSTTRVLMPLFLPWWRDIEATLIVTTIFILSGFPLI